MEKRYYRSNFYEIGESEPCYIGVDVGTGSVRAALVRHGGEVAQVSTQDIRTWNNERDHFEQSSDDIWTSCCKVVKDVTKGIDPSSVRGIGFDATCSLVVIDGKNRPLTVSPTGENDRNVILWMDHRAASQAAFINKKKPDVLKYVGGAISLEMQTPKLMWLKENLPDTWDKAKYFFDLPDFLTWKATSDDSRSLCSVVCKWTFIAGNEGDKGWDPNYFSLIGLSDLLNDDAVKIGSRVKTPGETCGSGLTDKAAEELGLTPRTRVGTSIIDAHAGGLGLMGCSATDISSSFTSRMALICGTSTCHMTISEKPTLVPGVWGPYYSAMVPGMWLNEAGQSATGKLLDHVIDTHPATSEIKQRLRGEMHLHQHLNSVLRRLAHSRGLIALSRLTARVHMWPDFHGNRSPLADPTLLGMISGLNLTLDEEDLAVKYLATIQALAYGTRHIIDTLRASGRDELSSILICGGLSKNELFVQTHADVLGLPVLLPKEPESVLLGAAMLGAVAAEGYKTVEEAVRAMGGSANVFMPHIGDAAYHAKKYKVFLKMVEDQRSYDSIMNEPS